MIESFEASEIIACAIRPQGSWAHLLTLISFCLAAWAVANWGRPSSPDPQAAKFEAPKPVTPAEP